MNCNDKRFKVGTNSENGEVSEEMIFHYKQVGNILTCSYSGENILQGHLIGKVNDKGEIDMRYHQINKNGELMTGHCFSTPEILSNGKIRLHEKWQWTSGDLSKGTSILDEI